MTDENGKNVRAIRKGIKIEQEEEVKLEPVPQIVELTKLLHELATSGKLRDIAYATVLEESTPFCGWVGVNINPSLLHTQLDHIKTMVYEGAVFPMLTGLSLDELIDEDDY